MGENVDVILGTERKLNKVLTFQRNKGGINSSSNNRRNK